MLESSTSGSGLAIGKAATTRTTPMAPPAHPDAMALLPFNNEYDTLDLENDDDPRLAIWAREGGRDPAAVTGMQLLAQVPRINAHLAKFWAFSSAHATLRRVILKSQLALHLLGSPRNRLYRLGKVDPAQLTDHMTLLDPNGPAATGVPIGFGSGSVSGSGSGSSLGAGSGTLNMSMGASSVSAGFSIGNTLGVKSMGASGGTSSFVGSATATGAGGDVKSVPLTGAQVAAQRQAAKDAAWRSSYPNPQRPDTMPARIELVRYEAFMDQVRRTQELVYRSMSLERSSAQPK
jgi:hypothetical protein